MGSGGRRTSHWTVGVAWTREWGGRVGVGKGGGGLLTLCLNSDFSSRVMVSALAMTGMMFTTLLRCFMNSRSRGRKLGPREGGVSEPPGPPPLSHCHHPRPPLGQEDWARDLAEARRLLSLLTRVPTVPPSAGRAPTLHRHTVLRLPSPPGLPSLSATRTTPSWHLCWPGTAVDGHPPPHVLVSWLLVGVLF